MERLELDMPETFSFSTEIPVRVDDVNYGGHLGNDAVLSIVHEARIRFLKEHGFTELDAGGPGLIMANAAVRYRSEGRLGNVLRVEVAPGNIETTSFDLYARLTKEATGDDVSLVKTGMVAYDYERETPVKLPDPLAEVLRRNG